MALRAFGSGAAILLLVVLLGRIAKSRKPLRPGPCQTALVRAHTQRPLSRAVPKGNWEDVGQSVAPLIFGGNWLGLDLLGQG